MTAVPAPVPRSAAQSRRPAPVQAGRRRRPDPALGVFETLLVLDGRPVERDAHLARLQASLATLFPDQAPPPLDLPAVDHPCRESTAGTSAVALRITVAPEAGGELAVKVERRPATGRLATEDGAKATSGAVSLRSLELAGGLGAHKWADRSLLDETQAKLPDDALPLILDGDGTVLEASRANVFAVRDGALFTPPLDGRVLPGVTRMRVLEIGGSLDIEAHETALHRDDLQAADEVFLTGSVRGIEPVTTLDGMPVGGNRDTSGRIAFELWRRWKAQRR
jgi:para-aminobenzoate synthetase/4-amino-4-deoxychorismate lyase